MLVGKLTMGARAFKLRRAHGKAVVARSRLRVVPKAMGKRKGRRVRLNLNGGIGRGGPQKPPRLWFALEGLAARGRKRRDLAVSRLLMAEVTTDRQGLACVRRGGFWRYSYGLAPGELETGSVRRRPGR